MQLHQAGHTLVSGASSPLPGCGPARPKAGAGPGTGPEQGRSGDRPGAGCAGSLGPAVSHAGGKRTALGPAYRVERLPLLPGSLELPSVGSCRRACPCLLAPAPGHPQCLWPLSSLQLKGASGVPSLVSFLGRVTTDPRLRTWASFLPARGRQLQTWGPRPEGGEGALLRAGWGPRPWF